MRSDRTGVSRLCGVTVLCGAAVFVLGVRAAMAAECIYWQDDFESYAYRSINGCGTSWSCCCDIAGYCAGNVNARDGSKVLLVQHQSGNCGTVEWWNDTGMHPTGRTQVSFDVCPIVGVNVSMQIFGSGPAGELRLVVDLSTAKAGSTNSLDMYDKTAGWRSGGALVMDAWNRITVQIDFSKPGDPYVVTVDNGTSCVTSGPYSQGSADSQTLGKMAFYDGLWDGSARYFLDNFVWSDAPRQFTRGDANADATITVADAVFVFSHLFAQGREPGCLDAADANDDGALDIADGIGILTYLFQSGQPLAAPFPACGADPTCDSLACASYAPCDG